jgi:hypothetical protein
MNRLAQACAAIVTIWGTATNAQAACTAITVVASEGALAPAQRNWLTKELREAAEKVCTWWGSTFTGRLTVDISPAPGPSMALVPAWRGQPGHMLFRAPAVRRERAATVHEVTHVFAPNANRFLAEGLAIYAHEWLRGPQAYPNFGIALHTAARCYAARADIAALDALATPSRLQGGGLGGREAYLVAGSFVRFLIEQHGLEKFRRLYAMTSLVPGKRNAGHSDRWRHVYGMTLDQLAMQWRNRLSGVR